MTQHQKSVLKWASAIMFSGMVAFACLFHWYTSKLDLIHSIAAPAKPVEGSSFVNAGYLFVIASGLMGAMLCFLVISGWFQRSNGPGAGHMKATWNAAKVDLAKDFARMKGRRVAEEEATQLDANTLGAKGKIKHPSRRL